MYKVSLALLFSLLVAVSASAQTLPIQLPLHLGDDHALHLPHPSTPVLPDGLRLPDVRFGDPVPTTPFAGSFAAPVQACPGIQIYGHWQKTCYNSQAEWVPTSGQWHLDPANDNPSCAVHACVPTIPQQLGHTHMECPAPLYGVINGPIVLDCQVQLVHVKGNAGAIIGPLVTKVEWLSPSGVYVEQIGFGAPPFPIIGNPHGIVLVKARVTINPINSNAKSDANPDGNENSKFMNNSFQVPANGWYHAIIKVATGFSHGRNGTTALIVPFRSTQDTNQPVPWWGAEFMQGTDVISGETDFGQSFASYKNTFLPIAPVTAPFSLPASGASYASSPFLPDATTQIVLDPDLHNGIPGTVLFSKSGKPNAEGSVTIDPTHLSIGNHKVMLSSDQFSLDGTARSTGIFVFTFTVGDVVAPPPPATCQDPAATNVGGPLPCTFPPPPPPPATWQPVTGTIFRVGDLVRTCFADGKCTAPEPVAVP